MNPRKKVRWQFIGIIALALVASCIAYPQALAFAPPVHTTLEKLKINLGLDLQGGIHLEYKVDLANTPEEKKIAALEAVEAVIERRVNAFGVGEPLVQLAKSGGEDRIIVELPGVKDIEQAKQLIKETPFLEFKEETPPDAPIFKMFDEANTAAKEKAQATLERAKQGENFENLAKELSEDPVSKEKGGDLDFAKKGQFVPVFDKVIFNPDFKKDSVWPELIESDFGWHIIKKIDERPAQSPSETNNEAGRTESDGTEVRAAHILFSKQSIEMYPEMRYQSTGLTGEHLKDAYVDYQNEGAAHPQVALRFDGEGGKLFAELTKRSLQKSIAIFLDREIISAPTVQSEITNGEAVITGNFTSTEAKQLVSRLNEGALPVPIQLVSQQSVSASLGEESLRQSLFAGVVGFATVAVFMLLYYRFLGLVAVLALSIYTALLIAIFKLSGLTPFPITLTLAGIAGFILSIGMAVDANILIAERTWEEIKHGKSVPKAIHEGFRRAWPSIRDGNSSTMLTCLILIWLGTGFVKGFALILLIGVVFSMFTAIVLTRTMLKFLAGEWLDERLWLIVPKRKQPDLQVESGG